MAKRDSPGRVAGHSQQQYQQTHSLDRGEVIAQGEKCDQINIPQAEEADKESPKTSSRIKEMLRQPKVDEIHRKTTENLIIQNHDALLP